MADRRNFIRNLFGVGAAATVAIPSAFAAQLDGKTKEEKIALIDALVEDGFMKKRTALRWKLKEGHITGKEFKEQFLNVKEFSEEEAPNEIVPMAESIRLWRKEKYSIPEDERFNNLNSDVMRESLSRSDESNSVKEYNQVLEDILGREGYEDYKSSKAKSDKMSDDQCRHLLELLSRKHPQIKV